MSKIRIDKFLSSQLNISRTDAKKLLKKKSVSVNDVPITKADTEVITDRDAVKVYGKFVEYKEFVYIMMNKPKGVVSSTEDGRDVTVIDILPESLKRAGLFPAGRLDKDTTGFVLITDNGSFAHDILSPSHHVKKTYVVGVKGLVNEADEQKFFNGMLIGDELFKPSELKYLSYSDEDNLHYYEIKIVEGRYHQIKRMFASVGNPVCELRRTHIGGLALDSRLMPGESRELTLKELELIKN